VSELLPQELLSALWSLGSFLVAIIILVTVHEFGHFWVARKVGVKVLRFSVGFGKPIFRWYDRVGTEYVIAAIPLGGYVKMLDEREGEVAEAERPFSFNQQTLWRRVVIVAAGPVANLVLAFCTFWVLFINGETGLAPIVGKIQSNSILAAAGLQEGHEIITVDGIKTVTRDDVYSALVGRIGDTGPLAVAVKRIDSDIAYELVVDLDRWLADEDKPDPMAGMGFSFYQPPFVKIVTVVPGSVAERAGLLPGDIVERVNGVTVTGPQNWVDVVRAHPGDLLQFNVRRLGKLADIPVVPAQIQDSKGLKVGQIGAQAGYSDLPDTAFRHIAYSPLQAAERAGQETGRQARLLVLSLYRLIVGDLSPKNLSGPLGIAKVTGASADMGLAVFCRTLAILSISLGVMNLFPIPMLDGGHLMMYLVESLKGSPVSENVQMLCNQVGMVLLVGLMLFAMYNDVLNF
jgi:regulator of sigma E protease